MYYTYLQVKGYIFTSTNDTIKQLINIVHNLGNMIKGRYFTLDGHSISIDSIAARLAMLNSEVAKADAVKLETTKEVLNCFSEKDAEALKLLLCPKTQELIDIDEQIQETFILFVGKVTSFNEYILGFEEKSIENGKKTFLERAWGVDDINTDANEVYEMYIRYVL